MIKKAISFTFLFLYSFSFGQANKALKLNTTGTYTEFINSLGKCIENKNIAEIKKAFFILPNKKIAVEEDHEDLYLETEDLCKEESVIKFGKLLQQTPRKVTDVTLIANRKAKHNFGLTIEKAFKIYLNTKSRKPHLNEVVVILYKRKWYLVDY
ncbi:MAG: hypothetical protein V4548_04570 [Bacteroidota bacterium]